MKKRILAGIAACAVALGMSMAIAAPASAGIKLYQFFNYSGDYLGDFGTGTSYVGSVADDGASSLKVTGSANYAILHQYRDYRGARTNPFYTGSSNLASWGFDNRTSSIS